SRPPHTQQEAGFLSLYPQFLNLCSWCISKKMVQWKNTGELKQKHKKNSLLAMPVLRTCRW
ncbi:MAG: hypothetical protein MSA44_04975, partial [Bacteroidales bacterium]|nr:hypothetical protein [Bacteroidales bacterium]